MRLKKLFIGLLLIFTLQILVAQEWYVCLASFKVEQNAKNYAEVLIKNGLSSWVYFSITEKGDFYRVLYKTPCDTLEKAHKLRDKVAASKAAAKMNLKGLWACEVPKEIVLEPAPEPEPIPEPVPEPEPEPEPIPEPELVEPEFLDQIEVFLPPLKKEEPVVLTSNKTEVDTVSQEKPYSVLIQSYKEEPPAIRDKERLEKNNIDAYILKTYDDNSYFSFDLHAGAFETKEETVPLLEQLQELGIENAEVSDYADIKTSLEQFNNIVDTTEVSYSQGNYEIPDSFSIPVQRIIAEYPVNQNFQLEKIEIFDVDNIKKNYENTQEFKTLNALFAEKNIPEKINALSRSEYADGLFVKRFVYMVATGPASVFEELEQSWKETPSAVYVPFNVKDKPYDCWYAADEESLITLKGFSKKRDAFVMLESSDFTTTEFEALLKDFSKDSSILVYPQIRKNLLAMPKKNAAIPRDFINFDLAQVDISYATTKSLEDWATSIVGHWRTDGVYFQDGKKISSSFFDLDYDYNARKIHQVFVNEHNEQEITESNHPCKIKNLEGWYVGNSILNFDNEISFSNKVYIVTVNSFFGNLISEEELIKFAEELQVWDVDEK